MNLSSAVRILIVFLLLLVVFSGPAASITSGTAYPSELGFWEGLLHGFSSLPKLIVSPFVDVVIHAGQSSLTYDMGYYVGVLLFAGAGQAAAASTSVT